MSELYHYGVPRMKHGVRNYQNRDGTWTELGKARRRIGSGRDVSKTRDELRKRGYSDREINKNWGVSGQKQQSKVSKWVDDAGDSVTDAVKTGAKKVVGDLRKFVRGPVKETADNAKESIEETAGQMRLKETAKNAVDSLKSVPDQIDDATARVRYKDVGNKFKKVFDSAYSPGTSDEDFKRIVKTLDSDPEIEKCIEPLKKEALRIQDTMYKKYSDNFNSKEARQEYYNMMSGLRDQMRDIGMQLGFDDMEYEDFYENHVGDRILDWTGNFSMASFVYHSDPTPDTAAIIHSGTLILGDNSLYLEHYGRPGQKWGVRNYQNPDGSLTPLGYIHYGYGKARKAAGDVITGTAKTAHKISEHVSASMAKAKKKHKGKVLAKKRKTALKKKEKLAKQKKEFSQTREDVIKNKDLFTTDELRALNDRFDVEDRLKMKESLESKYDYDSKKLAKQKEEASKSREGVLKNKELFTTDELRALSQRFDVEDDISMGRVRKGAEIVGKVADNAKKVAEAVKAGGEAYNVLTGKAPLKDKDKDKGKNKDKNKDSDDSSNDGGNKDNKKDNKSGDKDNSKSNAVDEAESRKMFTEDEFGRTVDLSVGRTRDFSNMVSEEESRRIFEVDEPGRTTDIGNVVREAANRANNGSGVQLSDADMRYIEQGLEAELRRIMAS